MAVLTLKEVKRHLRIETEDAEQEAYLESLSDAAKEYAEKYLGQSIPWQDSVGAEVPVPASVKAAMLLMISDLYENRESQLIGISQSDNPAFDRLLHFHRVDIGI